MAIRILKRDKPLPAAPLPPASDATAKEQQPKPAPKKRVNPLSTPLAAAPVVEQPSAPGSAPASAAPPSSYSPDPSVDYADHGRDTSKVDSLGNEKTDKYQAGPKGETLPPDVQTDAQRQAGADAAEAKLAANQAPTVLVDSVGKKKGTFEVTPGGHDQNGAKLPDIVDYSKPIEPPQTVVGPRGLGAPKDTFHGRRPAAKP